MRAFAFLATVAIASATSQLTFEDQSSTCTIEKSGDTLSLSTSCNLAANIKSGVTLAQLSDRLESLEARVDNLESPPTGYEGCYNTQPRGSLGWSHKGRVKTASAARSMCSSYTHMSLECPTSGGFEVWCLNNLPSQKLGDENCEGTPGSAGHLNGGRNSHCSGPYKWDGLYTGGWHRGALYKVNP